MNSERIQEEFAQKNKRLELSTQTLLKQVLILKPKSAKDGVIFMEWIKMMDEFLIINVGKVDWKAAVRAALQRTEIDKDLIALAKSWPALQNHFIDVLHLRDYQAPMILRKMIVGSLEYKKFLQHLREFRESQEYLVKLAQEQWVDKCSITNEQD